MSYTAKSDGQTLSASEYTGNLAHGYNSQAIYDADTGGDDAYIITVTPAISGYLTGMQFSIKVTTPNTGAATLNVNSLGAKTIKKDVSLDLITGDILANQIITVIYDGTNFILLNPAGIAKARVSSNDTTPGYLNGKLVAGEGIDLTENNDGGNETLTVSGEDASTSNKGIVQPSSNNFDVSSGVMTLKADGINDTHIDWGSGANQVDTDDIPEGTTNKFATSGSIGTGQLKTSTGSASGDSSGVQITMNDYSFFPRTSWSTDAFYFSGASTSEDTVGKFYLTRHGLGGTAGYAVNWRYVTASDINHWIYLLQENNKIIGVWEAPDHCPAIEGHPFGQLKSNQKVFVVDADSIIKELKSRRKQLKKSISHIIFNEYEIDKEIDWKEREIVEFDEFDEKEGELYFSNEDGSTLKKIKLKNKPKNISKFVTIKKK